MRLSSTLPVLLTSSAFGASLLRRQGTLDPNDHCLIDGNCNDVINNSECLRNAQSWTAIDACMNRQEVVNDPVYRKSLFCSCWGCMGFVWAKFMVNNMICDGVEILPPISPARW